MGIAYKLIFSSLLWLLVTACLNHESSFQPNIVDINPVEGFWESKVFTPGVRDTLTSAYLFHPDGTFEYRSAKFRNGAYQELQHLSGIYTIPKPQLLLLSYDPALPVAGQKSFVRAADTLIYKYQAFNKLVLCGLARTFRQTSGSPGDIGNSIFYDLDPYLSYFMHNRYVFRNDSLFLYSVFTSDSEEPAEWSTPLKFSVQIDSPSLILYSNGMLAGSITFAYYDSKLIITYTETVYSLTPTPIERILKQGD